MPSNRIFISHHAACLYWVHHDVSETRSTRSEPALKDAPPSPIFRDARRYIIGLDEHAPLHVLVHPHYKDRRVQGINVHSRMASYPSSSFRAIANDVFVASPELCFLQAATFLEFHKLVLYGFELCGTYARTTCANYAGSALKPNRHEATSAFLNARYKREPLTSASRLKRYAENSKGVAGSSAALRALKYVANGSASVRESQLVIMMTLPPRLGGYGLPLPQLNYAIEVNRPDLYNPGKRLVLHGDIVWSDSRLVIEYDGQQHGQEGNHASDKQRDHLLLDEGYDVVRFTNRQINDPIEIERLARTINRRGHLRRPASSFAPDSRKLKMQHELLRKSDLLL